MSDRHREYYETRPFREKLIAAYSQFISDNINDGQIANYVNFMFRHIGGGRQRRLEIMKTDVNRALDILTKRVVRKPNSEKWKHLCPIFLGSPDEIVWKHDKQSLRDVVVNDGLHINGIILMPPKSPLPKGMEQHPILPPQSRLKVSLKQHFQENGCRYFTEHLYRIHVTEITSGSMADYTFKAFKKGHVTSDDILV